MKNEILMGLENFINIFEMILGFIMGYNKLLWSEAFILLNTLPTIKPVFLCWK